MKGYEQVLDNLVYHAILCLRRNESLEQWDKLDDIVELCAKTYNLDPEIVYLDFETALDNKLNDIIGCF